MLYSPRTMRRHMRHTFIRKGAMLSAVDHVTRAFDVHQAKRDPEAMSLSGGLTKFVVARNPARTGGTRGVSADIGLTH